MKLLTVRKGNFGPQTGSIIEIVSAHAFTYICIYYIQYIQYIQYIKLPDTHYLEPEYLGSIWELGIPKYFECLVFTRSSIQNIVYFMGFIYLGSYNITKTPGSIYHEPHPLDSGLEAEIHQPNPLWSHPTHFSGHIYIYFFTHKSFPSFTSSYFITQNSSMGHYREMEARDLFMRNFTSTCARKFRKNRELIYAPPNIFSVNSLSCCDYH